MVGIKFNSKFDSSAVVIDTLTSRKAVKARTRLMSVLVFFSWILKSSDNSHDYLISSSNKDSPSNNPHLKFQIQSFPSKFQEPFTLLLPSLDSFSETGTQKQKTEDRSKRIEIMACFVPFNNRNLDTSFFVFRPTVVLVDEFVDTLKHFSGSTESLGCVRSSIFRSIHGNMVRKNLLYFLGLIIWVRFNFVCHIWYQVNIWDNNWFDFLFRSYGTEHGRRNLVRTKSC